MRTVPPSSTWIRSKHDRARDSVRAASRAIGGRASIIKGTFDLTIEPDDPRLFYAITEATNPARLYGNGDLEGVVSNGNSGAGLTQEMAASSAIGETIERFCCAIYDQQSLIVSSYTKLQRAGLKAVPPDAFALFSDRQYTQDGFMYQRFTYDTEVSWTWGYSLVKNEPVLVPACLVYLPYRYEHRGDLIADGVSTGLCCGRSVAEAILGGLYEVVERDAIMIMWMNQLPCPGLNTASGLWLPKVLQERFAPSNLGFYINDISTDIPVPVIFGLLIDERNEGMAVAVGASANLDAEGAALKALLEAAQGRLWLKSMKRSGTRVYREDFTDVEYFEDHVRLFGSLNSIPYVNFLTQRSVDKDIHSVRTLQVVDTAQDLERCVNVLAAKGFDVIVVNLTQPDIEDLGFFVVKVLVPGLVDINPNHNLPHLGGKRLYTVPRMLGYRDRTIREHEMTSIPHPFP